MTEEEIHEELHYDVADEVRGLLDRLLPATSCQADVLLMIVHDLLQHMTDAEDIGDVMNSIGRIALTRMSNDVMLVHGAAGSA